MIATIKNNMFNIHVSRVFKYSMDGFRNKDHKVLRSIIISNSIYMVNFFFRFKITTNNFFNNNPMFENISISSFKWMVQRINHCIPISRYYSSFPICHSHFIFRCFRMFVPKIWCKITNIVLGSARVTTEFCSFYSSKIYYKFSFAIQAILNHINIIAQEV